MDPRPKLTLEPSFQKLKLYHLKFGCNININDLFRDDPDRFEKYSLKFSTPNDGDILLDFSKNRINDGVFDHLIQLVKTNRLPSSFLRGRDRRLIQGKEALFGCPRRYPGVDFPFHYPPTYPLLRASMDKQLGESGFGNEEVGKDIDNVLKKMKTFCEQVHSREWLGYTGKPITDVVNIAADGSGLGVKVAVEALTPYAVDGGPAIHFISGYDSSELCECLKKLNRETVLFVLVLRKRDNWGKGGVNTISCTWRLADEVKKWFFQKVRKPEALAKHFVAATSDMISAKEFGLLEKNLFRIWDWIKVRHSLWSAAGLSLALFIGFNNYEKLHKGARFMDFHFLKRPLEKNAPVILAMISIWYINFYGCQTHAIIPYDEYLSSFPSFVQQLDMQFNGKSMIRSYGERSKYETGAITWGGTGMKNQGGFQQLLCQGSILVTADLIAPAISHNPIMKGRNHKLLLSNFLALSEALMKGKSKEELDNGCEDSIPYDLQRSCKGNIPTNSIVVKKISPFIVGALIALYEHKAFTQSVIWNIDTFEEYGLDLSQQLSEDLEKDLLNMNFINSHDPSTNSLINFLKSQWSSNPINLLRPSKIMASLGNFWRSLNFINITRNIDPLNLTFLCLTILAYHSSKDLKM